MNYLTFRDIESSTKGSVWVLNKTAGRNKGSVTFTVPKVGGSGSDALIIPLTFLPIDITEQVPKRAIIESSEFRRAVRLGLLAIISDSDADQLLNIQGADVEQERLRNEHMAVDAVLQAQSIGAAVQEKPSKRDDTVERIDGIAMNVITLMEEAESKDEISVINSLRVIADDLELKDYDFIAARSQDLGYKNLAKFCNSKIKELNEQ